jgi:hypothetical protein
MRGVDLVALLASGAVGALLMRAWQRRRRRRG